MRSFPDTVIEPCSLGSSSYKFISTRTKMSFFLDLYNLPDITLQNFSPPIVFQPHQRYDFHLLPPPITAVCLFFFFRAWQRLLTALATISYFPAFWQRLLVFPLLVTVPCIFDNVCLFSRALATVACFSEFWLQLSFSPAPWQGLLVFPRSNIIFLFKFPFAVVVNRSISTFI